MKKALEAARMFFSIFKKFVTFCGDKYAQIVFAIFVLLLLSGIFLSSYYLFTKIRQIEREVLSPTDVQRQADLVTNTDDNKKIDAILTNMLNQKHADRAYLFQLHDSLKTLKGQHFYFASNTNEVLSPGTAAELSTLQNLPIGQINDLMESFLNKECALKNVNSTDIPDATERQHFDRQGIKTFKVCPVYDVDETVLIGFVGVDWVKQPAQQNDIDHVGIIEQTAAKLSAIIE